MQPYFLPYLGAYQHVHAVDRYLLYGYVNFRSNGWFQRNRLIVKEQGPRYFNVLMLNADYRKLFVDIQVDPGQLWRGKLLKTIQQNYSKAPFFNETMDIIRDIVNYRASNLLEYNANSMIQVCKHLGIKTKIKIVTSEYAELENTLIQEYSGSNKNSDPCFESVDKKTARVLRICTAEKADVYVNPIGGQSLYDKSIFHRNGIELLFIKTREVKYRQQWDSFAPNLSILDVLMNCGRDNTQEFLQGYDLI